MFGHRYRRVITVQENYVPEYNSTNTLLRCPDKGQISSESSREVVRLPPESEKSGSRQASRRDRVQKLIARRLMFGHIYKRVVSVQEHYASKYNSTNALLCCPDIDQDRSRK